MSQSNTSLPRETLRETLTFLRNEDLKRLINLLGGTSKISKKADLVEFILKQMSDEERVRTLYEELIPINQKAVQEATHSPNGIVDALVFRAKYNANPVFSTSPKDEWQYSYQYYERFRFATTLYLFLTRNQTMPVDLQQRLVEFVPPPEPFRVPTLDKLPCDVEQFQQECKGNEERFLVNLFERRTEPRRSSRTQGRFITG